MDVSIEDGIDSKGRTVKYITYADGKKRKITKSELAGKRHPDTGVLYNKDGFPVFDEWSKFEFHLDQKMYLDNDYNQFKTATEALDAHLKKHPEEGKNFTKKQLEDIRNHRDQIEGLTWHHHQEPGKMQLVPSDIHGPTKHTGGRAIWGGGGKYR